MKSDRRAVLRWGVGFSVLSGQAPGQGPARGPGQAPRLGGEGESGTLGDPSVVGRPRTRTTAADNDGEIKAVEQKLACTCGCTLDIYTCRTTDFSCTYSPALHREVVALWASGQTPEQIIDTFVARYGEKALMAPKPEGFGLAGYLVPGTAIATAAAALAWVISRRRRLAAVSSTVAGAPPAPVPSASPEEWQRLRQAMAEPDD